MLHYLHLIDTSNSCIPFILLSMLTSLLTLITIRLSVLWLFKLSSILDYFEQIQSDRESAADPNDNSLRANTVRAACDWAARKGDTAFGGVIVAGNPIVQVTCRPYWNSAPYDAPEEPTPPFTGGQCNDVLYLARFDTAISGTITTGLPGSQPFVGRVVEFGVFSTEDAPQGSGTKTNYHWRLRLEDGREKTGQYGDTEATPGGPTNFRIIRADGQPDVCGDPPPSPVPPVNVPNAPNDGTPFDITPPGWEGPPIEITFDGPGPSGGDPGIPFDTPFGPGDIFGDAPSPGGGGDAPEPTPDGDPIDPPNSTGGDVDTDAEPENTSGRLVGYAWNLVQIPQGMGFIPGASPRLFPRIVGGISLKLLTETGQKLDSPRLPIREERGYFFSPNLETVQGLNFNLLPGFNVQFTQIRI